MYVCRACVLLQVAHAAGHAAIGANHESPPIEASCTRTYAHRATNRPRLTVVTHDRGIYGRVVVCMYV